MAIAPGDLSTAPLIARTLGRVPSVAAPAMQGGLSTGPRTAAGLEPSRRAHWIHGFYAKNARAACAAARQKFLMLRGTLRAIHPSLIVRGPQTSPGRTRRVA